jgi:transcription elongation factor Elf1
MCDVAPEPRSDAESASPGVPDSMPGDLARALAGGLPDCEQCTGAGTVPCPVCGQKGFVSLSMMDTVSAAQCRLCRGRCEIPCPSCRQFIYKSVVWWDQIPSAEEDPEEKWRKGDDGSDRIPWSPPPA